MKNNDFKENDSSKGGQSEPSSDYLLQQLFEVLPYGLIIFRPEVDENDGIDFRIQYLNHTAEHIFGQAKDSFLHKSISLFTEYFSVQLLPVIVSIWKDGGLYKNKLFLKQGKYKVFVELACIKFKDEIILSIIDNTSFKNSEKELIKINQDLKKESKIHTEKLKKKNQQLLGLNRELDNFVYTASHDLKSPISNIEGLLNALIGELNPENSEAHHIINLLHISLKKFKSTLQDLSEIAEAQNKEEEEHFIDVSALYEDIKISISDEIIKYSAIIEADFSAVKEIYFSRKNLRSIITNLITNALKYSSPLRRVEIYIKSYYEDGCIVLSVQDNGLGIKPEDKEKIFSVFKRVYTHVSGSGVGLYIVKRILENNGGKIEVESEINKGSIFKVFFKIKK